MYFSPVCDPKIEIVKDIDIGIVKVCLSMSCEDFGWFLCIGDNVSRSMSIDDWICSTDKP